MARIQQLLVLGVKKANDFLIQRYLQPFECAEFDFSLNQTLSEIVAELGKNRDPHSKGYTIILARKTEFK